MFTINLLKSSGIPSFYKGPVALFFFMAQVEVKILAPSGILYHGISLNILCFIIRSYSSLTHNFHFSLSLDSMASL
jgi:hypothetical protein